MDKEEIIRMITNKLNGKASSICWFTTLIKIKQNVDNCNYYHVYSIK